MGCWNVTCGISNLPICDGEKVYAFIVKGRSKYNNSFCEQTDYGVPISLPLEGTYNEYGSIENIIESPVNAFICNFFKKLDDDECLIWDEKPENFDDIEHVVDCIERGVTQEKDNYFIFFVLKDVFDGLTNDIDFELNKKYYLDIKKIFDNYDDFLSWSSEGKVFDLRKTYTDTVEYSDWGKVTIFSLMYEHKRYIKENFFDESDYIINLMTRTGRLVQRMSSLRRGWVKMSGDGGQDTEYKEYLELASLVTSHCNKKLKEFEDY